MVIRTHFAVQWATKFCSAHLLLANMKAKDEVIMENKSFPSPFVEKKDHNF